MSDNIRTDAIELLCTKEDFFELMDDNAKLCERIAKLEAGLRQVMLEDTSEHQDAWGVARAALQEVAADSIQNCRHSEYVELCPFCNPDEKGQTE